MLKSLFFLMLSGAVVFSMDSSSDDDPFDGAFVKLPKTTDPMAVSVALPPHPSGLKATSVPFAPRWAVKPDKVETDALDVLVADIGSKVPVSALAMACLPPGPLGLGGLIDTEHRLAFALTPPVGVGELDTPTVVDVTVDPESGDATLLVAKQRSPIGSRRAAVPPPLGLRMPAATDLMVLTIPVRTAAGPSTPISVPL